MRVHAIFLEEETGVDKTVISEDKRFEWDEEKDELNQKKHG